MSYFISPEETAAFAGDTREYVDLRKEYIKLVLGPTAVAEYTEIVEMELSTLNNLSMPELDQYLTLESADAADDESKDPREGMRALESKFDNEIAQLGTVDGYAFTEINLNTITLRRPDANGEGATNLILTANGRLLDVRRVRDVPGIPIPEARIDYLLSASEQFTAIRGIQRLHEVNAELGLSLLNLLANRAEPDPTNTLWEPGYREAS